MLSSVSILHKCFLAQVRRFEPAMNAALQAALQPYDSLIIVQHCPSDQREAFTRCLYVSPSSSLNMSRSVQDGVSPSSASASPHRSPSSPSRPPAVENAPCVVSNQSDAYRSFKQAAEKNTAAAARMLDEEESKVILFPPKSRGYSDASNVPKMLETRPRMYTSHLNARPLLLRQSPTTMVEQEGKTGVSPLMRSRPVRHEGGAETMPLGRHVS
uniref:Uncharacterized protein n=1 Tax=Spongospora subterranea TaxID=70186 RepID=A0A0H5QIJ2_9EUKA|eukprot:CRZ01890.1 hypothetical protein [Spongospora subterranea]